MITYGSDTDSTGITITNAGAGYESLAVLKHRGGIYSNFVKYRAV